MTESATPEDDDRYQRSDPTRPYRPGSRLRRALDLAREPTGPRAADPPVTPDRGTVTSETPTEPDTGPEPSPGGAAPGETAAPSPDPDTGTRHGRRQRPGRGLDALLPTDGPAPDLTPETWETAAQGWVQTEDVGLEWRPVVTTADRLEHWAIGTYLGIVSGVGNTGTTRPDSGRVEWAKREAVGQMVDDATGRGAHGVVGVGVSLVAGPTGLTVTAIGTAVTLDLR